MSVLRVVIIVVTLACTRTVLANDETIANLTCLEFKNLFLPSVFYLFSSPQKSTPVTFYLATKTGEGGVEIGKNNWSILNTENFNPRKKTHVVVHGYLSNYKQQWIKDVKEKILENSNANVIIVDWSKGSHRWNYVNAVQITQHVAHHLNEFLNDLKEEAGKVNLIDRDVSWNNLYFIGHSLGAHICGQVAHALRSNDKFYKVERISGLDPAQPCFTEVDLDLRLDKEDADFVDIIHTQTGNGKGINGLGLQEPIGHIDFYVNGGVVQPQCEKSIWNTELQVMICSHSMACNYFINSIVSSRSGSCKFVGRSWDRTYQDAERILNETVAGIPCSGCPEMGIDAPNQRKLGTYLVIAPDSTPLCQRQARDLTKVKKVLQRLLVPKILFKPLNLDEPNDDLFI